MKFLKRIALISLLVFAFGTVWAQTYSPKANEKAMVVTGNARFTVLTPQLLRMEWSEDGVFEERASLMVVNRETEVPNFKIQDTRSKLVIKTDSLKLTYLKGKKFSPDALYAEYLVAGKKAVWHYGDEDSLNLMGTTRTLDKCDGWKFGSEPMEKGIISRSGCVAIDDSANHLFEKVDSHWGDWVVCRPEKEYKDIYLFAYGHNYTTAIRDYTKIAGRVPLPPRYAFGYWWSRYWQYSDNELRDLVETMRSLSIPLDVLIVDMDWHETWTLKRKGAPKDEFGQRIGWTGYTWKEQLFPAPKNFLKWCHDNKLKTALNLHPASGIQPNEIQYSDFVKAYGWSEEERAVPFHIDEEKWADVYFETVLGPMEKDGVDFWWLDWQQWRKSKYTKNLSNTFWLNHVFNHHASEAGDSRPMIYHRWGGLGSHRYQVGFSGDTYVSWATLDFLPWFTSTASNVCYGYWGHDIGGHMTHDRNEKTNPELYLRWLQYGVFTPIFKTHCTKNGNIERRIWQFPDYMFDMRDAIRLRYTLAPYVYSAARECYDTGISICRPMYYLYPEVEEAYSAKRQHMFGHDLLVTSVAKPVDKVTSLAECDVWFPEGKWYDMATGEMIEGGSTKVLHYTLAENPYYARAGAIIPMNTSTVQDLQTPSDTLVLTFVPGGDGEMSLYEDDGISKDYADHYATTRVTKQSVDSIVKITIEARRGEYNNMPSMRKYELRLPAMFPPKSVKINGKEVKYARYAEAGEWGYDGYTLAPIIYTEALPCNEDCVVELTFAEGDMNASHRLYGKQGRFKRMVVLTPEFKAEYAEKYDPYPLLPDSYMNLSQAPNYITEYPEQIHTWLDRYDENAVRMIPALKELGFLGEDFITRLNAQIIEY